MSEIDQSFLPQIAGVFYAIFDPKLGPTVIHQVPEDLITSSSTSAEDAATRSRSVSQSRSSRTRPSSLTGPNGGTGGSEHAPRGRSSRSPSRNRIGSGSHGPGGNAGNGSTANAFSAASSHAPSRSSSLASVDNSVPPSRTPSPSKSIARTFSIEPAALAASRRNTIPLLDFALISDYVIPKKALVGKLVSFLTTGRDERQTEYRVMGFPCVLSGEGGKYVRNEYMWNLCFVFEANCSLEAFEPVVRKCARILRSAEIDSAYLSGPNPNHTSLPAVLEQLFEDLNSYSETSIPLDGFNSLEVKLFPFYPPQSEDQLADFLANPPEVEDWHVPIALADFAALKDDNWDITAARVSQHIDGVNHVGRIAQLADADPALVREVLRHMLFYQVIMVSDIFQYSNMYTLKPAVTHLVSSESITAECATYVIRKGYPKLSWPILFRLYTKLRTGITVHQWIETNSILALGIDPRRFVSFGIIKGFLRRVHRYPIMLERRTPLLAQYTGVIDYGNMHLSIGSGMHSGFAHGGAGAGQQRRTVAFKQPHYPQLGSANSLSVSTRHGESAFLQRSGPGDSTFTIRSSEAGGQSQGQSNTHTHSHTHTPQSQGQSRNHSHSQSHSTLPVSAVESSPGHPGAGGIHIPLPGRTPPGISNLGKSPCTRRTAGMTAMRDFTTSTAGPGVYLNGRHRDSRPQYREREKSDGDYSHNHNHNHHSSGYARMAGMPSDTSIPQASHTSNTALAGSGRGSTGGLAGTSGIIAGRSRRTNLKGPAARAKEANERRFEEELIMFLDGTHHADEIQVKFGLPWGQLEAILGLGGLKDGQGRKGVALIYR